ncbi:MAG: hypothetical protein LIO86_10105 [Lachnospiraceae bacterium]|nr:hypothetical protein [Lachnospiraceae bacterium]
MKKKRRSNNRPAGIWVPTWFYNFMRWIIVPGAMVLAIIALLVKLHG